MPQGRPWERYQQPGQAPALVPITPPRAPAPQTPAQAESDALQVELRRQELGQVPVEAETARIERDRAAIQLRQAQVEQEQRERQTQRAEDLRGSALDQIRRTIQNAREAQRLSREGWFTTGFGASVAQRIAPGGTSPADIQGILSQIGSNTAFDRLQQMREQSPTGGAVGNVTERELQLLRDSVASLDVSQSDAQFQRNMQAIIDNYRSVYTRLGGNPDDLDTAPNGEGGASRRYEDQYDAAGQPTRRPGAGESIAFWDDPQRPVPPGGEAFSRELQERLARGQFTTPEEIIAFGAGRGFNIERAQAQRAIQAIGRGIMPRVNTPQFEEVGPPPTRSEDGGRLEQFDAAMRGAADTMTMGGINYLAAAGNSALNGNSFGENLWREQQVDRFDEENNAAERFTGQVAGALVIPTGARQAAFSAAADTIRSGGTRAAAYAAARNAAARRLAAEGGIYSAVHGGATADMDSSLLDRAASAAVEGTVGTLTGGALPFAGEVVGRTVQGVRSVLAGAPGLADRIVFRAMRADGNSPTSLSRQAEQVDANGVPYMLADSGENARGLLSASARTPGPGRTSAINSLDRRQDELADRVIGAIERDLGPVANPHQIADDLMTQAQTAATPLYEAAYARPGVDAFVTRVQPLLDRPSMRRAFASARRIAAEEGRDPTALGFDPDEAGEVVLRRVPSWQTLDYVKRGMDDVIEGYRDSTTGRLNLNTEGRAINKTLRTFLRAFDEANPDYAAARAAYGGPVSGISAMNWGRRSLTMTADDIQARMSNMTDFERSMARLGARRAMAELAESRGDTANIVTAMAGTGKKRRMLARLFGNEEQFGRFVETLRQERNAFETFRRGRTGSPTAANVADDASLAVATGVADIASTGAPIISALRLAARAKRGRDAEQAQDAVAALLGETNQDQVRAIIQRFRKAERAQSAFPRRPDQVASAFPKIAASQAHQE